MPKLSASELADKKSRTDLAITCNRIKSAFSFKQIKTFYDLQIYLGHTDAEIKAKYFPFEYEEVLNIHKLKDILEDWRISLETKIWLRNNPPDLIDLQTLYPQGTELIVVSNQEQYEAQAQKEFEESEAKDYGFVRSPNEKANHYYFQKEAIVAAIHKITVEHLRALLIQAATGTGKTFIAGGILRRLLDMKFHDGKTYSPWPYLYVTKSTVVEQTKRVLENSYGISTITEVEVTNIEGLRSKLGEVYVQNKTIVSQGEAHIVWEWKAHINPIVIIWDECHVLKNENSTQSKIAQAYNDIQENTYQIFMSATPFLRVADAKCFSVGTRKEYGVV